MKIIIWAITAVVALMGTLLVAAMAFTVGWLSDNMAGSADWVNQLAKVPVPAWLSSFLNPPMVEWVSTTSVAAMGAMATGLPWLAPMLGWLVPILWVIWFLVLVCLLAVASGLHFAVGRRSGLPRLTS